MKRNKPTTSIRAVAAAIAVAAMVTPSVFSASQTWTNTPVDATWTNVNNWGGLAVPGGLNQTGNTVNNDTVTFNSALIGGIGGIGNPILTDAATATNGARARTVGSIVFDTPNVGPYVIQSQGVFNKSDPNLPYSGHFYVSGTAVAFTNGIRMNAGVANDQKILAPTFVRLPSSTDGHYYLINNSTNAVTMYVEGITNDSANTRGTRFILSGSNTGTNTVASISAGTTTSGGNGLWKQGSGTWILPNANDLRSQTSVRISDGTLIIKNDGAFLNVASANVVVNGGVLQLDGINLFQTYIRQQSNGVIRMNGSGTLNGVEVLASAGANPGLATTSAGDVFTVGSGFIPADSIIKGGAADTVLHTTGPGTIVLSTINTYVGNWSIDGGTNRIGVAGAYGTGANVNVGAGGTLDYTLLGPVTYTPSPAGFGGSGTGTTAGTRASVVGDAGATLDLNGKAINLTFTPTSFSGDLNHPSLTVAQGALSISGNTFNINNASGTPLGAGTYRLIEQSSGSITSGGGYAVIVGGSGLAAGTVGAINVSGGNVDLVVTAYVPKNLVWRGVGANWDIASSSTWLNGASPSVFNNSDIVTFNGTGIAEPSVNLTTTVAPASATVDTSSGDYTFTGAGQIGGTASLTKNGSGVLNVGTANSYSGGTVVNGGTLRLAANNGIPAVGGNLSIGGSATVDLGGFNNPITGLSGSGTVDVQTAGASTLTLGNNDASGNFSGTLTDSDASATLSIAKVGVGTQVLSGANTFSGTTTVSLGTLAVSNQTALGTGDVNMNAGTLDVATSLTVSNLAGSSGIIANNSSATTNIITITGSNAMTLGANVVDGSGGGAVGIRLLSGNLTMTGNSTYTGGTVVGTGATFAIPNAPAAVGGFVIASNGATLHLSGGSGSPGTPNSITTVDGATVEFLSGAEGKIWNAQFNGNVGTTNWIRGPVSFGQTLSFANFRGVVRLANTNTANQNIRFFNGTGEMGGDETVFLFERCLVHTRDGGNVHLGAARGGDGLSAGIGDEGPSTTYTIGGLNTTETFLGYIRDNNNNLVKIGTGGLILAGTRYVTNSVTFDGSTFTDYIVMTNDCIAYGGSTTVTNGTLKFVAPNNANYSTNIFLSGTGAVLDVTASGSYSNETAVDFNAVTQPTNTIIYTNGILEISAGESLNGFGSILGTVTTVAGSTVNVGVPIGTLNVSGSISLNGAVNMDLNRTNSQTADRLNAGSFSGTGTLNVANLGPDLVTGDTFQLFSTNVPGLTVNLPVSNALNTIAYAWTNRIHIDGTIKVLSGASAINPTPTNIIYSASGGSLSLSWPNNAGWILQSQTNSVGVGLSTNWVDVAGSASITSTNITLNATSPAVFYRLRLP